MRTAFWLPDCFRGRLLTVILTVTVAGTAAAQNYAIVDNTPGFIKRAMDQGSINPSTIMRATVWLKVHNEAQLQKLVQQQTRRGSSSYHKWITQAQFNASYGPTSQEVNSVVNFLKAQNLQILAVAENNFYVKVQGTAAQMEKIFHVQVHNYSLNGRKYRSNNGNPSLTGPAGGNIAAVTGLDDFGFEPQIARASSADGSVAWRPLSAKPTGLFFAGQCFTGVETHTFTGTGVTATYTGNRYGAPITNSALGTLPPCGYDPAEVQTAYNTTPLYSAGLNGTGETVVIVDAFGSATIRTDAEVFSQLYGLPDLTSSNFKIYRAPGAVNNPHAGTWPDEVTLDVEWVHAMAPGANIALVISPTNNSDLDEAVNYAVVHHLGNTISNSWATFEGLANPAVFNRVNRILEMAAVQGIDVNFASGDWGDNGILFNGFKTVCFPASSPFATGVGGTSLALNSDDSINWQSGWGTNITLIADTAAAGNPPSDPPFNEGFQFGAGGGESFYYTRPSFQSGISMGHNHRLVPDVSMLADPYTGVEIIETVGGQLSVGVIGGTSLATPMFSGLMAIAAQKNGDQGLGQAAALVYGLSSAAIADILPVGSATNVAGSITDSTGTTNYSANDLAAPLDNTTTYYSAFYNSPFSTRWFVLTFGTDSSLVTNAGWDDVTGLGTPNGYNFVSELVP